MRVRAVLEGRLLLQQKQQRTQQQQQQQRGKHRCAAAGSGDGNVPGVIHAAAACGCAEADVDARAGQLAAGAAMDEDVQDDSDSSPGPPAAWHQQRLDRGAQDSLGNGGCNAAAAAAAASAAAASDPAVQLLLSRMWPLLHDIITQHGAAGRLLYHYGKCCSQLLKVQPGLLLPQLQQVLQVVVAGAARPGGCSLLAEPFAAAIEVCCRQGSGVLLDSGSHIVQALQQLWCVDAVAALTQPGAGDAAPDLAEPLLKLYTCFAKHGRRLHASSATVGILRQATAAAASCAGCCHRKVASSALSLLSAVPVAASCEGPQQRQLLELVCAQGADIVRGVIGALLAPSPLPRLQKASAVLLDMAGVADQVSSSSGLLNNNGALAAGMQSQHLPQQQQQQLLHGWLVQAAGTYAAACISSAEAARLSEECSVLLCSRSGGVHATRSYTVARRLKKLLRDFAERHMRPSIS
ncbi:hypothetical protein COO60DRAFT_876514 [Scenedesmus sp. NREL 46B-D3]|nr:hypothetical protein COO60DRAFT_876514 [Scenedesmus sp. NREL 46B-D3]